MRLSKHAANLSMASAILSLAVFASTPMWAQNFRVIHSFGNTEDGITPVAGPTIGPQGYLYGTVQNGGPNHGGIVYELRPNPDGSWSENIVRGFDGTDGCVPLAPVSFDGAGNLYTTTSKCPGAYGGGTVVEFLAVEGSWSELLRHAFGYNATAPALSRSGVAFDTSDRLYGTTTTGGQFGYGVVFSIGPGGSATTQILHAFGSGTDGRNPYGTLVRDRDGNFYGTARNGGAHLQGIVFKLSPGNNGNWTYTIIHEFNASDSEGANPDDGLIFDIAGNLYGTTERGPIDKHGSVFKLSPNPDGTWTHSLVYGFKGANNDGDTPVAGVTLDSAGNLYGTTQYGGSFGRGSVYKLTPGVGGSWNEALLYSFSGGTDGWAPFGRVAINDAGNVYGTTAYGGTDTYNGVAFQITQQQ